MISTEEIRDKEIINILDGKSLGYVSDIEIDLQRGRIDALVVPAQKGLFSIFSGGEEYVIKWKDIKRIGEDVILAEVREACVYEDLEDYRIREDYANASRYHEAIEEETGTAHEGVAKSSKQMTE